MSRVVKDLVITDLLKRVGKSKNLVVLDASRMDAMSQNSMRLKLRQQNILLLSVKNTLAVKALGDQGITGLASILKGPSVLAFGGQDIVMLSKEITKWTKDQKTLQIKGGVVDGTTVGATDVEAISKGPTREELIGKIVQLMLSPGANLAAALLGPGASLASQIKSVGEEKEKESESAEPAAS